MLARIWAEVLGVERVGRRDGFFELGGDSILALKLVERARKAALRLLPRQVFEHQSLAAMARVAQLAPEADGGVAAIPRLAPALRAQPLQPSYAQLRQWFLWQLDPTSSAYHIAGALRLFGALEMDAVRTCFAQLLHRHEALRTVFPLSNSGQPQQVVLAHMALDIAMQDLQGSDAQSRVDAEIRRVSTTPFDLTQGPLLRVAVLKLAEAEHVLVVAMHHIVSDGWSLDVIIRDFVALYRAHVLEQPSGLPELPVCYADYAAWQMTWMDSAEKARQLGYWTQQLGDEHPILELPLDHARQASAQYGLESHGFELEPALAQRLKARAHEQGATLFMLLLAGLQVQLSRYSGQPDMRVGVPIANRHRPGTAGMVGMFVNTQVLRSRIDGHASLGQIIAQARQAVLEAQAHQDLPFDQLVEALQPERNIGINPLFQVMHNHQRVDTRPLEQLPGLRLQEMRIGGRTAQFELTLNTTECADGRILVNWAYARELFDTQTLERMAGHYRAILQAMAERPQQAVRDLELVDGAERGRLCAWGVNDQGQPYAEPVHRVFEHRVRAHPGATALVFEAQALSYAELNARANRLAHRLIALGVGPEVRVGVAAHRSVEMVVALLAVLKAGGAYVPLDPEYPEERLAWIAEDSRMQLLLTQSSLGMCIPGTARLERLELDRLDLGTGPAHDPAVPVHGENLAYVIYTSGSTGRPKGAANRHSSLASCMNWMQRTYVISGADAVLHKAPFGFDVSVWEIFWPLTAGARLVVSRPGDHRDPERIIALILQHGITTLNFVPSMLQAFLAHERIDEQARLRYVICGGEAMPSDTQREALRRLPGVSLQNLYGPTETTIHVTRWTCRDEGDAIVPNVPIGRPIDGIRTYVLDADLNLVAPGMAGELYLGGTGLGRGYVNRSGLTSERFVANPVDGGGELLYRTGDLVRWNAEAQIEYLGRIDHQVKIRGLRIELGEIEARLLAQPEVREAVVVACEGPNGPLLVGYVAAHQAIEPAELRQRLARDLPDYMVPAGVVVLHALPLNANGKVDRKALPAFVPASATGYEPPQGETEALLADLWSEVLEVPRVGRNDHFFDLGGNSMAVIRLQLRVQQACGASVGLRTYFEKPLLSHLAVHIDDDIRGSKADKVADFDLIGSILEKVEG
ncbi:amino acid adenylation domain-containing protein [Acidovorax sp. SUPP2825]|uniref:amino acid adenylation domain-containing protein n=1 Tax=Acidovorax sp. SUPP2825 TaxID=2920879 RepID=UPI0023DE1F4A|nr:amino acid adenylation domain-containing protein [Acidovorax sp. SUPP2825]GKS97674.1 non-ribosomal peptide synthetase [Acidovorax sp. SUPP2825]